MADFSSIILRFRDLGTVPGATIAEHQKIIDARKFVWWGWWSRRSERIPESSFRAINARAEKGPLDIFLFDSGQDGLHRAKLMRVEWDKELKLIDSPDPAATPGYYSNRPYYAWFKLTEIESASQPASELKNWSYAKIDENSNFQAFDNKLVSSFAELHS
jgi:hypothetical protein